jgi:acetyl-CoA carboxylase biotin carboxylase subunit
VGLPTPRTFSKVLIANRGEIALRILCACKELGLRTVAIYSQADSKSLAVRFADEAICIGPPRPADSYLNIQAVVSAAKITHADAIHPGYGLLSENPRFAEACAANGIAFIGPPVEMVRLMGEKEKARAAMQRSGVPIIRGSQGTVGSPGEALEWAQTLGFPLLVKASAGGGGRGMRVVRDRVELPGLFQQARAEAQAAFGNGDLYLEQFLERPRHIEFQVLGDSHGHVVSLGERECSVQRRHQKLIEESPSLKVSPQLRSAIGEQLENALSTMGYSNAGTVEFLMNEQGELFFIEMNARIQVEHPVTEMVTNVDLVKAQILIAMGERLENAVGPVEFQGHAMECRINAEHPVTFTPSAGKITAFQLPGGPGVRIDTAAFQEADIPPHYDSLIAKLVVRGADRKEALTRMTRALDMFVVEGIHTSIPLHRRILADPDFRCGNIHTEFMERFMPEKQRRAA